MNTTQKDSLASVLRTEFEMSDEQSKDVLRQLDGIVQFEVWETDYPGPDNPNLYKTTFDHTTGLPIVHSRKMSNYKINLRKLYTSSELHETLFDVAEAALSVPRLLYRIARFAVTESKLTLGDIESAIYYLIWKDDICPVETSEGYELISERLRLEFGEKITHDRYQAALDELVKCGLITIQGDIVALIEFPWGNQR